MGKKLLRTKKQQHLLEVLANPQFRDASVRDICNAAGITTGYFRQLRQNPAFIEAVQTYCAGLCIQHSPGIIAKFAEQAKKGQFKHGELLLKVAGIVRDTPLIQMVMANLQKHGLSEDEVDKKIAQYFYKQASIDVDSSTSENK